MTSPRLLLASATTLATLMLTIPTASFADEPIPVVATFSILGDMLEVIGGEHIALTTLVGPKGDAHVYQPTPKAARAVAEADVLFMNGLEFEGWLERLIEAAPFNGSLAVATLGIDPITFDTHDDDDHDDEKHDDDHDDEGDHVDEDEHDDHDEHNHGTYDPHAWLSPTLAITYVNNITAALAQADPSNANDFYKNRAGYVAELKVLNAEVSAMMTALPQDKRTVVTSHDAFQYFARDYGLTFKAPQGISTEAEASAKDVAKMIEQIREEGISAVFVENIADQRLLKQIASETNATIGGTLFPDALSKEDGPASSYLDLIRHNATTLSKALGG
jgi:zinc/manganese transport system substrate-binding protein